MEGVRGRNEIVTRLRRDRELGRVGELATSERGSLSLFTARGPSQSGCKCLPANRPSPPLPLLHFRHISITVDARQAPERRTPRTSQHAHAH